MRKPDFCIYAKIKTQITAKLISAFVFATWIVQSLFYLNPKSLYSSHLLLLYRPVCVGPGRTTEDRFSHNEAQLCQGNRMRIDSSANEDCTIRLEEKKQC